MPRAIIPIAEEINLDKYIISGNGAQLYDLQDNKIVYNNYLKKEKVLEIISICEENNIFYNIYMSNKIITKALDYNMLFYNNINRKKPKDKQIDIKVMDNIYKYIQECENDDFLKITVCTGNKVFFKKIKKILNNVENIDILEIEHMSKKTIKVRDLEYEIKYFYTEIKNKNVNKWNAIHEIMKKNKIQAEEVLTIGDNINDKEMILNAGLGIVTANCPQSMKTIANEIVPSNNENRCFRSNL